MIPIVVCTVNSISLNVLKSSVETYAKNHPLLVYKFENSNFGDSYNQALDEVFEKYDEVIIANDDVVILPSTIPLLLGDVQKIKLSGEDKIGFVATMADTVRPGQNVRFKYSDNDYPLDGKWASEYQIKYVPVIAPIFAWFNKKAFSECRFPPINWFSDDVICDDLNRKGYKHFISSSYVHHVGSTTVGKNYDKLKEEAMAWVRVNRPEYVEDYDSNRLKFNWYK